MTAELGNVRIVNGITRFIKSTAAKDIQVLYRLCEHAQQLL